MSDSNLVKVAAVQAAPVVFDLEACITKAEKLIKEASDANCDLIVFGEAWFPGYPFHIWLGPPAWSMQYTVPYFDNSMEVDLPQFQSLQDLAQDNDIMISAGFSERDQGSLYLSQALIDRNGELISVRRKLKPTHVERTVFGEGYGEDLSVTETAIGNVGQLCCWEHIQPLNKYALFSQNEQLHCAAWPAFVVYKDNAYALGATANMAVTKTYAIEGQCFVIAGTSIVDQQMLDHFQVTNDGPKLLQAGGGSSMVFGPDGKELAEYLPENEEGLVVAELDFDAIKLAKAVADPCGHYSKPESTQLLLHTKPLEPVVRTDIAPTETPDAEKEEAQ